jgi:hypothetical protein
MEQGRSFGTLITVEEDAFRRSVESRISALEAAIRSLVEVVKWAMAILGFLAAIPQILPHIHP